jgi:hypothetical protein
MGVEEAQIPVALPEADRRIHPRHAEPEEGVLERPFAGAGGRCFEWGPVAREEAHVGSGREEYHLDGESGAPGGEETDPEGARPSTDPARVQATKRATHQERDQEDEGQELGPSAEGKTVEALVVGRRHGEQYAEEEEARAGHQVSRPQPCPTACRVTEGTSRSRARRTTPARGITQGAATSPCRPRSA